MMSAEDKDKMTMKFVKPSLPLFANTEKDKFVIPSATLLTFLLAIAPGYLFYKSMQPDIDIKREENKVSSPSYTQPVIRQIDEAQAPQPSASQNTQQQQNQGMSPKAQDLFNQADYAFRNREYDKALTLLQVASGLDPNNQMILNAIDKVKNEQRAAINSMQIR